MKKSKLRELIREMMGRNFTVNDVVEWIKKWADEDKLHEYLGYTSWNKLAKYMIKSDRQYRS